MSRVVIAVDMYPLICDMQNSFQALCAESDRDISIRPVLDYLVHCALWSNNLSAYNHAQRWVAHYLPYAKAVELIEQMLIAMDDFISNHLTVEIDLTRYRLSFELRGLGDLLIYRDEIPVTIDLVEQQRHAMMAAILNGDHIPERERLAYGL